MLKWQFLDKNSIINILLLAVTLYLGIAFSPWFFLIWPAFIIIDDLIYYLFSKSIFNREITTKRCYQFGDFFYDNLANKNRDLGFSLYDGNLTKTPKQAINDKDEFIFQQLALKAGDKLIDIGCGYGDWLAFAKAKGVNVVGINFTPEQAEAARKNHHIEVICINWKDIDKNEDLKKKLYGQFDAVTFLDSFEHYVKLKDRKNIEAQGKIYHAAFTLANNLLNKNSHSRKVFISTFHRSKPMKTFKDYLGIYLLDKMYSGYYAYGDQAITQWANPYFKELMREDRTEDYRITSVVDKVHFGAAKIKLNLKKILYIPLLFLLDPHHSFKWIYYHSDVWMWWHFGDDAYNKKYDNEYQKQLRRVTLWWILLKQNS